MESVNKVDVIEAVLYFKGKNMLLLLCYEIKITIKIIFRFIIIEKILLSMEINVVMYYSLKWFNIKRIYYKLKFK